MRIPKAGFAISLHRIDLQANINPSSRVQVVPAVASIVATYGNARDMVMMTTSCIILNMAHRQMSATEFKATCLSVLDEVHEHGGSISITKRGKPVATLQAVGNQG